MKEENRVRFPARRHQGRVFFDPRPPVEGSNWASFSYGGGGTVSHDLYQTVTVAPHRVFLPLALRNYASVTMPLGDTWLPDSRIQ